MATRSLQPSIDGTPGSDPTGFAASLVHGKGPLWIAVAAALLCSAALVELPPTLVPYFIVAFLLGALSLLFLVRPVFLLWFLVVSSSLSGLQSDYDELSFGHASFSVSGLRWGFLAAFFGLMIVIQARRRTIPRVIYPMALFVGWVVVRWAISDHNWGGLKDILFFGLPLLAWMYGSQLAADRPRMLLHGLRGALYFSAFLLAAIYGLGFAFGAMEWTAEGPYGIVQPRPTSLYLLVVLAVAVGAWRYERPGAFRLLSAVVALLTLGLILFTLSRTASIVAFSLIATVRVDPTRTRQIVVKGLVGAVLFLTLVYSVPTLKNRFFFSPDTSVSDSFSSLNTMGRSYVWPLLLEQAMRRPVLGHGPGRARQFVAQIITTKDGTSFQPHNEYLQVFHDMGAVGLGLLLLAWGAILLHHWREWRRAGRSANRRLAQCHMVALLGLGAILLTAVTDNTLHYAFVLVPACLVSATAIWASRAVGASAS